jgi:hypothetical protein
MKMQNDNITLINAKPTRSADIMDRIVSAIEIMRSKGFIVNSTHCSAKLFMEIAKRFAPKVGYLERKRFLVGPKKDQLLIDKNLVYSEGKQFYLKLTDPITGKQGMMFPHFVKKLNIPDNLEIN